MPPLSARRSDIPEIAHSMAETIAARIHAPVRELSPAAARVLSDLPLQQNLISLETIIGKAMMEASPSQQIEAAPVEKAWAELRAYMAPTASAGSLETAARMAFDADGFDVQRLNGMLYALAMDRAAGNVARAAELLGLSRPQLAYRLRGTNAP